MKKVSENLSGLILTVTFLLLFAADVFACSCDTNSDTVETAFRKTPTVAVFRLDSVVDDSKLGLATQYGPARLAVFTVRKVYKGKVSVGDQVTFSNRGICVWSFDAENIGKEYLLYLSERPSSNSEWWINHCSRSASVNASVADRNYLDKRTRVLGKTRLSGTLNIRTVDRSDPVDWYYKKVSNVKMVLKGTGRELTINVDQDGAYEVYDLAPGDYKMVPPTVEGYSPSSLNEDESISVKISAGKHTETNLYYDFNNSISGALLDNSGQPLGNVCDLELLPVGFTLPSYGKERACTNRSGIFEFSKIVPGDYVLVGNKNNEVSSRAPFKTIYFPGTNSISEATKFSVDTGTKISGLKLVAPEIEGHAVITGKVIFSDGKPYANGSVRFYTGIKKASEKRDFFASDSFTTTDENGRFRMHILKGHIGILSSSFEASKNENKHCSEIGKIIDSKSTSLNWASLETIPLEIRTDQNMTDVELKFQFSSCGTDNSKKVGQ